MNFLGHEAFCPHVGKDAGHGRLRHFQFLGGPGNGNVHALCETYEAVVEHFQLIQRRCAAVLVRHAVEQHRREPDEV